MKTILYILSFLLLFASCKEKYHVSGRVYNPVTNEGLSGVRVTFKKFGDIGVGTPSGYEEVASTFTDANGNYDLKSKKQASWVQIETSTDLYELGSLQNGTYIANVTVNKKENMIVDWHAVPYGNLVIHAQNINCLGPDDTLQLFLDGSTIGFDDIQIGMLSENYGCINLTGSTVQFPMGYRYYHWNIIRGGVTTTVYDTVFVSEGGTSYLEILY